MEHPPPGRQPGRQLVVVAFFDQRPLKPVRRLLASMDRHPAGCEYDCVVVVNTTDGAAAAKLRADGVWCMERENRGMNIGAWDHGWRQAPEYDGYLFLQDDCVVVRDQWIQAFVDAADGRVGLVGESRNEHWDQPWEQLRRTRGEIPMREHELDGRPANRVDLYLDFMVRHGIDPGESGDHLRGQVWYATRKVLGNIGGFPLGGNRGECIAAEIGVSRTMLAHGWTLAQVAPSPFHYIRHVEWERSTPDGPVEHADSVGRRGRLSRRLRPPPRP